MSWQPWTKQSLKSHRDTFIIISSSSVFLFKKATFNLGQVGRVLATRRLGTVTKASPPPAVRVYTGKFFATFFKISCCVSARSSLSYSSFSALGKQNWQVEERERPTNIVSHLQFFCEIVHFHLCLSYLTVQSIYIKKCMFSSFFKFDWGVWQTYTLDLLLLRGWLVWTQWFSSRTI